MKIIAISAAAVLLPVAAMASPTQEWRAPIYNWTYAYQGGPPAPVVKSEPSAPQVATTQHWRMPVYNWMYGYQGGPPNPVAASSPERQHVAATQHWRAPIYDWTYAYQGGPPATPKSPATAMLRSRSATE